MATTVSVERPDEHVAVLTLDGPPRNELTAPARELLRRHLRALDADLAVRAVVLTGSGAAFSTGADLHELAAVPATEREAWFTDWCGLTAQIESARFPVVAAVNGFCAGGALELCLACDLRIAARTAQFVAAGVNVGLVAGLTSLPRAVGEARAAHLLLTGLPLRASEAAAWGLVTEVHPARELRTAAITLARLIARRAPLSVEGSKRVLRRLRDQLGVDHTEAMVTLPAELAGTQDHQEAVTALGQRRDPVFRRR